MLSKYSIVVSEGWVTVSFCLCHHLIFCQHFIPLSSTGKVLLKHKIIDFMNETTHSGVKCQEVFSDTWQASGRDCVIFMKSLWRHPKEAEESAFSWRDLWLFYDQKQRRAGYFYLFDSKGVSCRFFDY